LSIRTDAVLERLHRVSDVLKAKNTLYLGGSQSEPRMSDGTVSVLHSYTL